MKKLIATMIVSVIVGQPILAGPLSMDTMAVNGGPKLQGKTLPIWLDGTVMAQRGRGDSSPAYSLREAQIGLRVGRILGGVGALAFRRISGVGAFAAFSLVSWLQFDRASDYEAEAALNREHGQLSRAQQLDDKAGRARLYGWSTAALAAGSLGVALISRKTTRRVLPELSFRDGEPHVGVSYAYSF